MAHKANWRKWDGGSAQVEFAFSALFMLVALLTLVELCNAVYTFVVLSEAANEGVRYAIVHSTDGTFTTDVTNKVTTYASAAPTVRNTGTIANCGANSQSFVAVTCPDSAGGCPGSIPGRVRVTVCYPYAPLVGLMNQLGTAPTMTAYAEGRLVY